MNQPCRHSILLSLVLGTLFFTVSTAGADEEPIPAVPIERIGQEAPEAYVHQPVETRPGWYFWGGDERWQERERDRRARERDKRWKKRARAAAKREERARKQAKRDHPHGGPPGQRRKAYDDEPDWDEGTRRGPEPRPRHEDKGRVRIVFDTERGIRIVVDRPGVYFEAGRYYRLHEGRWQVGIDSEGDWRFAARGSVPLPIRRAHEDWYTGRD